ncbi:MAG TPA: hypothetical protein VJB02_02600 [Coxiellaceae bacterium]|nr:hypothetical protein [Coxiellaceae bacterium]
MEPDDWRYKNSELLALVRGALREVGDCFYVYNQCGRYYTAFVLISREDRAVRTQEFYFRYQPRTETVVHIERLTERVRSEFRTWAEAQSYLSTTLGMKVREVSPDISFSRTARRIPRVSADPCRGRGVEAAEEIPAAPDVRRPT